MDTKAFIVEIFNRPPIWMYKHPQHRYKIVIKRLWNEIRQCFPEFQVEQLKKKWKNLKDAYRKELKKSTILSGEPDFVDDPPSHWKYFNNMAFIKDEFLPAESKSNLKSKHQNTASEQEPEPLSNVNSEHRNTESDHETEDLSNPVVKSEPLNTESEHKTENLSNLKSEPQDTESEDETIEVSILKSEHLKIESETLTENISNRKSEHQNTEIGHESEDLSNLKLKNQNTESEHETDNLIKVLSPSEEPTMSSPSPSLSPRALNVSPQPCCSRSNTSLISRKRLTPNDIRAEYLEIEKKKLKILEQEVAQQNNIMTRNSPEKTDDYYYLMSLLPEMQKFTSIQKMRLRNKINQVLLDEMTVNNK